MLVTNPNNEFALRLNQRVRAILLTDNGKLMFIKRVKPDKPPYWVAPGGGVEDHDEGLLATLHRELFEELGATVEVMDTAFVLRHQMGGKDLEEHFFICKLLEYDLDLRNGPEFDDPTRGEFIPVEVEIDADALNDISIKTTQLRDWLLENSQQLQHMTN